MKKLLFLVATLTLVPIVAAEIEESSEEEIETDEPQSESEEPDQDNADIEAAQVIAQQFHQPAPAVIAQQTHLPEAAVARAMLWLAGHAQTPMPTTPLNYTADQLRQFNRAYEKAYYQKQRQAFTLLNIEDIYKNFPDLDEQTIDDAFKYYRSHPVGLLPVTKDRIRQLAQKWHIEKIKRRLVRQRLLEPFYTLEKNKEDIYKKYPDLDKTIIDDAFKYYRANPRGALPDTRERILELAPKWPIRVAQTKEALRIKRSSKARPARKKESKASSSSEPQKRTFGKTDKQLANEWLKTHPDDITLTTKQLAYKQRAEEFRQRKSTAKGKEKATE